MQHENNLNTLQCLTLKINKEIVHISYVAINTSVLK
jgi:hypothetical protein